MAISYNPVCPTGQHAQGCVTADPEDTNPDGTVTLSKAAWDRMRNG